MTMLGQNDRLLDTIYRCALGLGDWTEVARDIRDAVPDVGVVFHLHEARSSKNIGLMQIGFDPGAEASYLTHFVHQNPWLNGMERLPIGGLHHTEDVCARDDFLASSFWNDWLKPQGDFASGSGLVLTREFERTGFLGINYSHRHERPKEQIDHLLHAIGPHLQRAFSLWRNAAVDREKVSVFQTCMSKLPIPFMIVDRHLRLRFANPDAERVLKRMDGLVVGSDRMVHALDRSADRLLSDAVARVATEPRCAAPLVAVPKTDWSAQATGQYIITPFPAPAEVENLGFGAFSFYDGSLLMLAIHDTDQVLRLDQMSLVETFDLTPTEAELADALLQGLTLADYAKRKKVSRYTVRNQLSSVMRKTGTHRQSQLVGLLTRLAMTS